MSAVMLRAIVFLSAASLWLNVRAAEMLLDFNQARLNEVTEGFRSVLTGKGKPGDWNIVSDVTESALPRIPGKGPEYTEQSVLAQLSAQRVDDRYPLLIYEGEVFDDFVLQ